MRVQVLSFDKSSVSYAIQFEKETTVSSTSVTQIITSTENLIRTGGLTSTSDFEFDSSQKIETADSMCIIQYFILIMHTYHMSQGGESIVFTLSRLEACKTYTSLYLDTLCFRHRSVSPWDTYPQFQVCYSHFTCYPHTSSFEQYTQVFGWNRHTFTFLSLC